MTYTSYKHTHEFDPIAKGILKQYRLDERMAKAAQITKSKKLGPEDLKVQDLYFVTGNGFSLFRTREAAVTEDWQERLNSLNWHEVFLVVHCERLHIAKPGAQRKYLLKVMAGEKMGWFTAFEVRKVFKKLEPNAIEQDNSVPKHTPDIHYKSRQWTWSLLPKK